MPSYLKQKSTSPQRSKTDVVKLVLLNACKWKFRAFRASVANELVKENEINFASLREKNRVIIDLVCCIVHSIALKVSKSQKKTLSHYFICRSLRGFFKVGSFQLNVLPFQNQIQIPIFIMKHLFILCAMFLLCSSVAFAQPANDICANAITLPISTAWTASTNVGTVVQGTNPSCGGSAMKDVWYSFVYTGGTVTIETQLGTNTDTRLAVYSACGGAQLGCNDDISGSYASRIILTCPQMVVGNTYKIQAGGYNQVVGTFNIRVIASGVSGCTDPQALNYLPCAAINNGTCTYNVLNATFTYASAGTNCLNIQYTSTSTGNITGYSWSFPGGMPSSSALQNPTVTYPSAGVYSATLTAVDATPNSSTLTNNAINVVAGDIVTIDITPDANPAQTSWKLFDSNNVIILQGTSNDASICIPGTCHRFEIYDSANNGLNGAGNYKIYVNGILVANGQTFGSTDIRPINCTDGISCDQPIYAVFGNNAVPFDNTWFAFTPQYSGQYKISTCGLASCDTKIWVYDYCTMANFDNSNAATLTYNDDLCGVQAESNIFLAGGITYYVRVGSTGACAGQSYQCLFQFVGTVAGCMDELACNFNPLAGTAGPCYYNGDPNCVGLGPDLAVSLPDMFSSLTSTTINSTNGCLVNEGCLQGTGLRQILRFTTRINNIGNQDYFIGVPNANNPQFEYDACHNHYHYEGYAEYLLYDGLGNPMPQIGFKNGFCVLDLSCPAGITAQYGCGNMGITAGCADYYSSSLDCQWVDITDVPAGSYYLAVRTNWDHSPDANGHYELRYDNNIAYVCISFGRDGSNNIINFTKSITNCTAINDCVGTPFGNEYPDCQNNCPGIVITGDVNNDGYFTSADEHAYAEAAVNGGIAVSPCTDLNNDGAITVADAAYAANCIHTQQDLGVPPLLYTACNYDNEFLNQSESATLGLTNLNTTLGYVDVYITNAQNEIKALQFEMSGVVISSVVNLLPTSTWNAHLHKENGGNAVCAVSEGNTEIPINVGQTPIIRVYYSSLTSNSICISNIVDILNDLHHNILANYGNCQSVLPAMVADFSAFPQAQICSGQSIDFIDATTEVPTQWLWSFPGGTPATSTVQNPSIDYLTQGTYSVTLTASNMDGSDTETKTNYITVGNSVTWYQDIDGDGFGTSAQTAFLCTQPSGYAAANGDCNDNNLSIHPNALEICNNIDDDCDGLIDEGFDNDNDSYTTCEGDCNDNNALSYPGAFELCNGADEDCDGLVDEGYDVDNDTYTICEGDCNDSNAAINPGATEICNNIDDDCDGSVDEGFDIDNDTYTTCEGDCNDNNAAINPGATEICNNIDDDCDGNVDEGFDQDNDGSTTCEGDCNDNNAAINPDAVEICNNIDDDCDGSIDEGFDIDNDTYTICEGDCNDNNAAINPGTTEICGNGIDDNCANGIDEGCCTMTATANATNSYCSTSTDGSVTSTVTGGTPPFSYLWSNGANTPNLSNVGVGTYTLIVTDNNGCTANANATVLSNGGSLPATPTAIDGPLGICKGQSGIVFSVNAIVGAASYIWTLPSGATGASTTNSISLNFSNSYSTGNICVRGVNPCGEGAQYCRSIVVYSVVPATPIAIFGGNTGACPNSSVTYSVANVANASSYLWVAPTNATVSAGQGTTSATITYGAAFGTSGTLSVRAVNCKGNSGLRTLIVYGNPGTPGAITGPITAVCGGSTQNYSVIAVNGATSYDWTVPAGTVINSGQGTTGINVTFPAVYATGAVSVTASSICGTSLPRTITVAALLGLPNINSGQTSNLCGGGTFTYTIVAMAGATGYNWTLPAGCSFVSNTGTSITITIPPAFVSGYLCVTATNTCGIGPARCLLLSAVPATPASITGSASVCPGAAGLVYSTAQVSTYTYTWIVPTTCTIVSGQGTNTINVNWGAVAGFIYVKANNTCGSSAYRSKSIALAVCAQAPGNNSGIMMNLDETFGIDIYPNPNNGSEVNMNINADSEGQLAFKITDVLGKAVYSNTYFINQYSMQTQIMFEHPLPSGLYLIEAVFDNKRVIERFVVEK